MVPETLSRGVVSQQALAFRLAGRPPTENEVDISIEIISPCKHSFGRTFP